MTARPAGRSRRPLPWQPAAQQRCHAPGARWWRPELLLLLLLAWSPQRVAVAFADYDPDNEADAPMPPGDGGNFDSVARQTLLQANNPPQNRSAYARGSPDNGAMTGVSYNNPNDFPIPADYEPVMTAVHRIVGPYVIKARQEMEMAFNSAFANYYQPLGVEIRWLNFTVRPATNIGPAGSYLRSSMRAVDEQALIYQQKGVGDRTNLTLGSLFNHTAYLQQLVTVDYGFADASLVVLSEKSSSTSFRNSQDDYGAATTTLELYGNNLFPFSVDKQNVVLLTLTAVFNSLPANPVFHVNISNISPDGDQIEAPPQPQTGRRLARRLLQNGAPAPAPAPESPGTLIIQVWTGLDPLSGINMADLWNRTLNQANAQQLYVINGDGGIGVAYTYRNFTSTSQYYGLALTGNFVSSELYRRSSTGDYTVAVVPQGPPYQAPESEVLPPGYAPQPGSPLGPGKDFGYGYGPNPGNGLPVNGQFPGLQPKKKGHNVGLIAGVTVGAFFAGALLLALLSLLLMRKRRGRRMLADGKVPASSDEGSGSQTPDSLDLPAGNERSQPWSWDVRNSGVVEPVVAGRARAIDSPMHSHEDIFPSLHRAHELFANDTARNSRSSDGTPTGSSSDSSRESSAGSPRRGGRTGSNASGNGTAALPSSAPFVAGELDPSEIDFCQDADGQRVLLGEGAFGRVYKGVRRGVHEVAVKQLGNLRDPQIIRQFRKEIAILGRVSFQPNIVNFYGACLRDPANIMLVMELMEGGDLRHALSADESEEYTWWGKGASLALDIAHGLHFLHSSGVTHRDLKTSNILLSKGGTTAKIGDVGLAKITLTDLQSSLATVGTFVYAAPELLMGERCTEKADIFSFGVCMWEIVTGDIPQRGYLRDVLAPAECPDAIRTLLSDCMASDPAVRPSAEDLVRRLTAAPHNRAAAEAVTAAQPPTSGVDGLPPGSRRVNLQPTIHEGRQMDEHDDANGGSGAGGKDSRIRGSHPVNIPADSPPAASQSGADAAVASAGEQPVVAAACQVSDQPPPA